MGRSGREVGESAKLTLYLQILDCGSSISHPKPGPSTAAPQLPCNSAPCLPSCLAEVVYAWVSICLAPHPYPTSLKQLRAERAGVQLPPAQRSGCCSPQVSPRISTPVLLATADQPVRALPQDPRHTLCFCIHRQSSRQPALTGTDAPSPAAPKRACAQQPKLTTPRPESNPVYFCFQKQACFMQTGVHTVPQTRTPAHAHPRTRTQPIRFFLRKAGFWESALPALLAPGIQKIPALAE